MENNMNNTENQKSKNKVNPVELYSKVKTGCVKLFDPFEVDEKTYAELEYDFGAMTGNDYVNAMDTEGRATYQLTNRQAIALFCQAVVAKNPELTPETIQEKLGVVDYGMAIRRATNFFIIAAQAVASFQK